MTGAIDAMVIARGDDNGLVLPSHVAPLQMVIVPITNKKPNLEQADLYSQGILMDLKAAGVCTYIDACCVIIIIERLDMLLTLALLIKECIPLFIQNHAK